MTVVLVVLFVPAQSYYLLFVLPVLAAASCSTLAERSGRVASSIMAAAFGLYLGGLATPIQQMMIHATLTGEQRLEPNVAIIRSLVPRGSVVLSSEYWSAIANDYDYRSLVHGEPDLDRIDYVILTGNGSGSPGTPQPLAPAQRAALAKRFVVIHDNLPRHVPRLFGFPLSRSGWGYGMLILRRVN